MRAYRTEGGFVASIDLQLSLKECAHLKLDKNLATLAQLDHPCAVARASEAFLRQDDLASHAGNALHGRPLVTQTREARFDSAPVPLLFVARFVPRS